jgi:hypothetical protein
MHRRRNADALSILMKSPVFLLLAMVSTMPLHGQNSLFDAGSTGAMGPLKVNENTVLNVPPDGVFHFTTINFESGILTFNRNTLNTPVYLLAQGEIVINGWIVVSGRSAVQSG